MEILSKRIFALFLIFSLCVLPSFAEEGPSVEVSEVDTSAVEVLPEVDSSVSDIGGSNIPYVPYAYQQVYALPDNARIITAEDLEPSGVDISVQALDPVTPSNSNGLKAILLDIIGDYSAITVEYRYTNSNGTYNYLREVQPDYVWMGSALLFIVLIWCTFKLGGAILCKK